MMRGRLCEVATVTNRNTPGMRKEADNLLESTEIGQKCDFFCYGSSQMACGALGRHGTNSEFDIMKLEGPITNRVENWIL